MNKKSGLRYNLLGLKANLSLKTRNGEKERHDTLMGLKVCRIYIVQLLAYIYLPLKTRKRTGRGVGMNDTSLNGESTCHSEHILLFY